jgi:hypothetical protein
MKNKFLWVVFFIPIWACIKKERPENFKIKDASPYNELLFPIVKNQKFGFINVNGTEIIAPVFTKASDFSEGLAAAKLDDKFGFIDSKGEFVIRPIFDYAEPFHFGLAKVFMNEKLCFITKNGEIATFLGYESYDVIAKNRIKICTKTKHYGLIDFNKKLVADTIYGNISAVLSNVFEVEKNGYPIIIDNNGKELFSYKDGYRFELYGNNIIKATKYNENTKANQVTFLNLQGENLISSSLASKYDFQDVFCEGLAKVKIQIPNQDSSPYEYYGFVNEKGDLVINNKAFFQAHSFRLGRSFVLLERDKYAMINKLGLQVGKETYSEIGQTFQKSGFTLVRFKGERNWSLIDTNAVVLFKSNIQSFDYQSLDKDLGSFTIDNKKTYVNAKGEIIWQQIEKNTSTDLNIDYMRQCSYYTPESNKIKKKRNDNLQIIAANNEFANFENKNKGFLVYIINNTEDTLNFSVDDKKMSMIIEAQNQKGEWKPIEYNSHVWCASGYAQKRLIPSHQWVLEAPKYIGSFQTKLRFCLDAVHPTSKIGANGLYYSNEFEGRINPTQFWRKEFEY